MTTVDGGRFEPLDRDRLPHSRQHEVLTKPELPDPRTRSSVCTCAGTWPTASSGRRRSTATTVPASYSCRSMPTRSILRCGAPWPTCPAPATAPGPTARAARWYASRAEYRDGPAGRVSRGRSVPAARASPASWPRRSCTRFRSRDLLIHPDKPIRDKIVRRRRSWVPAVLRYNAIPAQLLLEVCNLANDGGPQAPADARLSPAGGRGDRRRPGGLLRGTPTAARGESGWRAQRVDRGPARELSTSAAVSRVGWTRRPYRPFARPSWSSFSGTAMVIRTPSTRSTRSSSGWSTTWPCGCPATKRTRADLTQEIFLRIYRHLGGFRGTLQPQGPGSSASALNTCRSRLRRRQAARRVHLQPPEDELDRVPDPKPGPESRTLGRDMAARLGDALRELPLPFREAVVLRDVQGFLVRRNRRSAGGARRHRPVAHRARPRARQNIHGVLRMSRHATVELLSSYIDEELVERERRALELHLADCGQLSAIDWRGCVPPPPGCGRWRTRSRRPPCKGACGRPSARLSVGGRLLDRLEEGVRGRMSQPVFRPSLRGSCSLWASIIYLFRSWRCPGAGALRDAIRDPSGLARHRR